MTAGAGAGWVLGSRWLRSYATTRGLGKGAGGIDSASSARVLFGSRGGESRFRLASDIVRLVASDCTGKTPVAYARQ